VTLTTSRPQKSGSLLDRAPLPVLTLIGWTLFVWVTRIRNIGTDEGLSGWSMIWRLGVAGTFVVTAASVVLAVLVRPAAVPITARALAGFGIVVWLIRGVDIAVGDHDAAFIIVHLVLAGTTIALGLAVFRRFGPWFGPWFGSWPSPVAGEPGLAERPVSSVDDG